MRAVIQRVSRAAVRVGSEVTGSIGHGLLILVAFQSSDGAQAMQYIAEKIVNLRVFEDSEGKMNLSVSDVRGELLIVSQFTLYGDVRKGRRPSYSASAEPVLAEKFYEEFLAMLRLSGLKVAEGRFKAHMEVELVNDGPVTILLDSDRLF